jgi:hypothetical protein
MRHPRLEILAGVALILARGGAALAEVKDATASGLTVENAVPVPVAPMKAWKALGDDADRCWPAGHTWRGAETPES